MHIRVHGWYVDFGQDKLDFNSFSMRLDAVELERQQTIRTYLAKTQTAPVYRTMDYCARCHKSGHSEYSCAEFTARRIREQENNSILKRAHDEAIHFKNVYNLKYLAIHLEILERKHKQDPDNILLNDLYEEHVKETERVAREKQEAKYAERERAKQEALSALHFAEQRVIEAKKKLIDFE